jgi:hypothetical protein
MPVPDLETVLGWRGRTVLASDGEKLGKLGDLYLEDATDLPAYAGVRTGLLGRHESIVPLDGIEERDGDLVVPYEAALVRDAPAVDPDVALTEDEQRRLLAHYDRPLDGAARQRPGADDAASSGDGPAGDGPQMIRSEEELVTGTTDMRPTERVRLRKVLVHENVTRTVPVRREEIRLETDPPPDGDIESVEDVTDEAPGRDRDV